MSFNPLQDLALLRPCLPGGQRFPFIKVTLDSLALNENRPDESFFKGQEYREVNLLPLGAIGKAWIYRDGTVILIPFGLQYALLEALFKGDIPNDPAS